MLDCELFWLNAGMHHLINLLFHIANGILLFMVLRRMTGAIWPSGFVAALFALHPLHVESVAWVPERKDVLSTFFWMLTMLAYVLYTEQPGVYRYFLVVILFFLGFMSKAMLVTLPFVLLLMDYWPLGRLQLWVRGKETELGDYKSTILPLILEKVPLLALSAILSIVTFIAQGKAVASLDKLPLGHRVANALISYVAYIGKMFWPQDLAVFYPNPGTVVTWQSAGCGLLLLGLTLLFIRVMRNCPYLAVGWLWYIGTLVPVIGLVQVGSQAMADRYTYIPLIGLFIMIAWGVPDVLSKWRYKRVVVAGLSGLVLSILMVCTWLQVRHWKNSVALFSHAVNVTDDNYKMHINLGLAWDEKRAYDKGLFHYSESLRINPGQPGVYINLGRVLSLQGDVESAIRNYSEALRIEPDNAIAHYNLGIALESQNDMQSAIKHYSEAVRIRPDFAEANQSLKLALLRQKKLK
jgi:tetratricopeptide (TPR) repeat protein